MPIALRLLRIASSSLALMLASCISIAPDTSPRPEIRAEVAEVVEPSAESVAFSNYYRSVEAQLISNGLLRTDGGGPRHSGNCPPIGRQFRADRALR